MGLRIRHLLLFLLPAVVAYPQERLRVGVEINASPMAFVDERGDPRGFTVDILREIERVSDLRFEIVPNYWTNILNMFNRGELDLLGNVMLLEERRSTMAFSIPHATVHGVIYARPGLRPIRSTRDLAGKQIGVMRGSIAALKATQNEGWGAELIPFTSWQDAFDATYLGQIDGTLLLSPASSRTANDHNLRIDVAGDIGFPHRFALQPGDTDTLGRINDALLELRADGTFDRLFAQWIGPIEPRPIYLRDLRPYLLPSLGVLLGLALLFWWQRHVMRRIARQAAELRRASELLNATQSLSRVGGWSYEVATDNLTWTEGTHAIHETDPAEYTPTVESAMNFYTPDSRERLQAAWATSLRERTPYDLELEVVTARGKRIHVRTIATLTVLEGKLKRVHGAIQDITDRKRAEQDRLILSKLESTGMLAGGIAHDFNNLLTVIVLNLGLAQRSAISPTESQRRLGEAAQAALAAQRLTQQLITFARGGAPVRQTVDLARIARESTELALSGSNVRAEFTLPPTLGPLAGDPGQLGQLVHNLVLNAREAMPEGGVVRIHGEQTQLPAGHASGLPGGDTLHLSVSDEGGGVPEDVKPRIFDPYFSTKGRGVQKGMGLGLTICHSVAKQHGGAITMENHPGLGATFHLWLPPGTAGQPETPPPATEAALPTGPLRILVMDDEPGIRDTMRTTLDYLGHRVEDAPDGETALRRYHEAVNRREPFDLVLLDLTVRDGMGGLETMRALQVIDPAVKAIVMSGYGQAGELQEHRAHGFHAALAKPFTVDSLRGVIERARSA
jgi:signal transduction histidine kinase/CheY-like chemotaxis protein